MHELALANDLLRLIERVATENGGHPVTRAHLLIGDLTHAEPETLRFAFEVVTRERPLVRGCELTIERVPIEVRCPACDYAGVLERDHFACPRCDGVGLSVVAGRELRLSHIEVEDAVHA